MQDSAKLGIRWTVGAVSRRGFEALSLSIWGAWRLFGGSAGYAVCVNSLPVDLARARTGKLPPVISWHQSDRGMPDFLEHHLDAGLAEGVAWKFAPLRLFPDRYELALDNDCILWDRPAILDQWLAGGAEPRCLLAEDRVAAFGQFASLCGPAPLNTGMRGLPPGFDVAARLREALAETPVRLVTELDEQGLQVAALSRGSAPLVVALDDVAICSPLPPHTIGLGRCGAHFVGINVTWPRRYCDGAVLARLAGNWDRHRARLAALVGGVDGFSAASSDR